jgi:hypothetical protein
MPLKDDWEDGDTFHGSDWNDVVTRLAIPALPNAADVEAVTSAGTVSVVANSYTTTISSGVLAATMIGTPSRIGKIGTTLTNAVTIASTFVGPGWKEDYAAGTFGSAISSSWAADIWVSGSRYVEFIIGRSDLTNTLTASYRVWVDGKKKTDLPVTTGFGTSGQPATIKVDFGVGNTKPHRVKLDMFGIALSDIWTEANGVVWAANPTGPRLFVLGPSLEQGTAGPERHTGGELGTWFPRFANLVGITDWWNGSEGGTGPFTDSPAGNFHDYVTRVTSTVVPADPDILIIGTWINDQGAGRTGAQIAADYGTAIDTVRASALGDIPIIVMGGIDSAAPTNTASMTAIDNLVKPVCITKGAAFVSGVTGEVVGFDGSVLATTHPWINSANKSIYISADNLHPTDAGQEYIAYMMREAWKVIWN